MADRSLSKAIDDLADDIYDEFRETPLTRQEIVEALLKLGNEARDLEDSLWIART